MVDFRPFRAVRYTHSAGLLADLICPPYDVISESEEKTLLELNPNNMVRMELAELVGPAHPGRYTDAAAAMRSMLSSGALERDETPSYYLLRQSFVLSGVKRDRFSLLGALRLEELGENVLPHENTAPGPKEDRLALMQASRANFSPLMMLYRDESTQLHSMLSKTALKPPTADFSVDAIEYAVWVVSEPELTASIAAALRDRPVYVADGHHRYETSLGYRDEVSASGDDSSKFVLVALIDFDDPGLAILPYYRVIHGASPSQITKLRELLSFYFVSRPSGTEQGDSKGLDAVVATLGQGQVVLGLVERDRDPQLLSPANDIIPEPDIDATPQTQVRTVEAFVIQEMLLKPVFGDAFPDYVSYVHDGEEAIDMVCNGDGQLAFFVKGLPADVFQAVVGAGIRLPRKSTYFHPKLPSGLVINVLEGAL